MKIKPVSYPFTPPSVSPSINPDPTPISTYDAPSTSCSASFYQDDVDRDSRKEKSSEAWSNIRPKLVPAMVSGSGFPASNQLCIFCGQNPVSVWCPDCGPLAYLCEVFSTIDLFWWNCYYFYLFLGLWIPFTQQNQYFPFSFTLEGII